MDTRGSGETRALREAKEWSRKLSTADEVVRGDFVPWIKKSPQNLKAFLLNTALDTEMGNQATRERDCRLVEIDLNSNVRPLPMMRIKRVNDSVRNLSVRQKLPWSTVGWVVVAATIIVALLIAQHLPSYFSRPIETEFITNIGEIHTFTLPDGTLLQLNTNSHVAARYSAARRDLFLEHGEIWIDVAHDLQRPFRVRTGRVEIQDIGTVFTVRTAPTETAVYVVKGRTRVSTLAPRDVMNVGKTSKEYCASSVEIGAGTEAVIKTNDNGAPSIVSARRMNWQDANKRVAWTRGRLILTGERLRDVIREVNRYQKRQIVIADQGLGMLSVGGTIDPTTNEYQGIMRALAPSCSIIIDDSSNASIVQLRIDKRLGCRLGE